MNHDPFMPLLLAAEHTERMEINTALLLHLLEVNDFGQFRP